MFCQKIDVCANLLKCCIKLAIIEVIKAKHENCGVSVNQNRKVKNIGKR